MVRSTVFALNLPETCSQFTKLNLTDFAGNLNFPPVLATCDSSCLLFLLRQLRQFYGKFIVAETASTELECIISAVVEEEEERLLKYTSCSVLFLLHTCETYSSITVIAIHLAEEILFPRGTFVILQRHSCAKLRHGEVSPLLTK